MEVPGVDKSSIDIRLEKGVLTVKGTIDSAKYESLRPIYSEYNVGNFVRTFTVSTKIDSGEDLRDRRRWRADGRAAEGGGGARASASRSTNAQRAPASPSGRSRGFACDVSRAPNASSTLPGEPTMPPLPAVTYSIPPATTGPGPSIEPPSALTPLTVVKSRLVSNVQSTRPSSLA